MRPIALTKSCHCQNLFRVFRSFQVVPATERCNNTLPGLWCVKTLQHIARPLRSFSGTHLIPMLSTFHHVCKETKGRKSCVKHNTSFACSKAVNNKKNHFLLRFFTCKAYPAAPIALFVASLSCEPYLEPQKINTLLNAFSSKKGTYWKRGRFTVYDGAGKGGLSLGYDNRSIYKTQALFFGNIYYY